MLVLTSSKNINGKLKMDGFIINADSKLVEKQFECCKIYWITDFFLVLRVKQCLIRIKRSKTRV